MKNLFREEARDSHQKRAFGDIVLVYPISSYFLFAIALGIVITASLVAYFGKYTREVSVPGVLEPINGLVKQYASQEGTLKEQYVHEGQTVHKGEILLVFDSQHPAANGEAVESSLDTQLQARLDTLHRELDETLKLQVDEAASTQENLISLHHTEETLTLQIDTQKQRVKAALELVERYEGLNKSGFMPIVQVQDKKNELMDQQMRLQELDKELITTRSDINKTRHSLQDESLHEEITKAQLQRSIASTEAELSKQEGSNGWSVVSPCDGIISSLTISKDQTASPGVPLSTIIPSDSELLAKLYASSKTLGFIKIGQRVSMKIEAFPYQKFGQSSGIITSIAESPVTSKESFVGTQMQVTGEDHEPFYTIKVKLDNQFVDAYGDRQPLRPGMQLSASIKLETRALFEWALEPIYSLHHD